MLKNEIYFSLIYKIIRLKRKLNKKKKLYLYNKRNIKITLD